MSRGGGYHSHKEASAPSSASLVAAAAAGSRQAWDDLVDRYAQTVWAVARSHRLDPDQAAAVSHATWMRFVENLGRIQDPDSVGDWLSTTARREAVRVLRFSGRRDIDTDEGGDLHDSDLSKAAERDPSA